ANVRQVPDGLHCLVATKNRAALVAEGHGTARWLIPMVDAYIGEGDRRGSTTVASRGRSPPGQEGVPNVIQDVDAEFHFDDSDPTWSETNYFGFYNAEHRLNVGVYALFRTTVGS